MKIEDQLIKANQQESSAKQTKRRIQKYITEVDENREFFLSRWGYETEKNVDTFPKNVSTKISEIALRYGCSMEELLEYIAQPQQIETYQRKQHMNDQSVR